MSSKPAPMSDDKIDYGYPPGNEHLTFEEFIQDGEDDITAGRTLTSEQVRNGLNELRASLRKLGRSGQ